MEEEKALKQLRRTLVPHARPVPNFANPFLPQKYASNANSCSNVVSCKCHIFWCLFSKWTGLLKRLRKPSPQSCAWIIGRRNEGWSLVKLRVQQRAIWGDRDPTPMIGVGCCVSFKSPWTTPCESCICLLFCTRVWCYCNANMFKWLKIYMINNLIFHDEVLYKKLHKIQPT